MEMNVISRSLINFTRFYTRENYYLLSYKLAINFCIFALNLLVQELWNFESKSFFLSKFRENQGKISTFIWESRKLRGKIKLWWKLFWKTLSIRMKAFFLCNGFDRQNSNTLTSINTKVYHIIKIMNQTLHHYIFVVIQCINLFT